MKTFLRVLTAIGWVLAAVSGNPAAVSAMVATDDLDDEDLDGDDE